MINFKLMMKAVTVAFISSFLILISAVSFAATDVRIMWYGDGDKENVPMQRQIDEFNAANPDINVILDVVPYEAIQNTLPVQLAAGEGPDIGEKFHSLIPESSYYCMEDAAHWPQWEHPEEHDQVLIDFIGGKL